MIPADETFDGAFPFAPHFSDVPGFKMHYVDEGGGAPIVCLHGEPTWGFLYRNFIPPLAKTHRVVVPDHMGFGKSETPQDRQYVFQEHVENLEALLIRDLDLQDMTLVMQDWGGLIGGAVALRNPDRVARIFMMNTLMPFRPDNAPPMNMLSPWFQWIMKGQKSGAVEAVLGNLNVTILSVMKLIGFVNTAAVDDTWVRAYAAPFPTKEECKGAIQFPLDALSGSVFQLDMGGPGNIDKIRAKPIMLAEGLQDHAIPPDTAMGMFRAQFPDAPIVPLPNAGHFCQEDVPETLVAMIQQFVQST